MELVFRELLRGPLYYVLVLIFCAVVFWRDSPVGMISIAMMSGGDGKTSPQDLLHMFSLRIVQALIMYHVLGIADIIGRRFGGIKIPYNPCKSWAGSVSMFLFGFLISVW